ncbi:unnamed protein product, partial [Staurois parvus]
LVPGGEKRKSHSASFPESCDQRGASGDLHRQKLTLRVLRVPDQRSLTVRGDTIDPAPSSLPLRIRQIVTENLSPPPEPGDTADMSSLLSVQEENRILQQELSRVEDLLAQSRAERDELAIKYNAISERLEQTLRLDSGERERDSLETRSLAQQNVELRRRLEEEQAAYKRKLQAYQEGQQRQAQLVQKLQAKVLQYKKRCGEVEQQLLERSTELEHERLSVSLSLYEIKIFVLNMSSG